MSGPWSRSTRQGPPSRPRLNAIISNIAGFIMPLLMVAAALLARHNIRLGRGDRAGATRAATFIVVTSIAAWLLSDVHVGVIGIDVQRGLEATADALFNGALMWLTYLGLEPYIRRYRPDSLLGWSRIIRGHWRDARVATDVLVGVSVGLAMTVLYGLHNVLPPLFGYPEPMPLTMNANLILSTRQVLSNIVGQIGMAVTSGMLGVVGIVALVLLLKRTWAVAIAGTLLFLPAIVTGMFPDGTPRLDLAIGLGIGAIFVMAILHAGLLASVAALATHFVLLRAPITTDFSSWRGSAALWYLGVVAVAGFGACYLARTRLDEATTS